MDFDMVRPESVSRLSAAARAGDSFEVKRLLQSGSSPNAADNRGWTCLHEAAANGHAEIVGTLLDDGRIDIDGCTFETQTPLILAAEKDHASVVEVLLDRGADIHLAPPSRRSAFIVAADCDSPSALRLLIEKGVDVNETYFSGWTALHFAAHNGFHRIVEILLEVPSIDVNAADKDGLTPLFLATQSGAKSVFEMLLDEATKRNIRDEVVNARAADGSGITPVFLCAQEGHLELLRSLVRAGANIDVASGDESSSGLMGSDEDKAEHLVKVILPIHSAIERNLTNIVGFLAAKMKPNSFRRSAPTPFHFCVMWNSPECLEALISCAPVSASCPDLLMPDLVDAEECLVSSNVRVNLGYTHLDLLGTAVYFENVTMVRRLLRLGANPNPRNPKVFPPLLLALGANDKSVVLTRLLLEFGAEATIYHPEVKGNLALLSCLENFLLMMTLISFGADVDSLFHPRPVKQFVYMFLKNDSSATEPPLSLLRLLEGGGESSLTPLASSSKRRFNLLKFLLPLVFTVPIGEYAKYRKLLRGADWNCLQSWTRWPPSLAQLCRRQIRLGIAGHNWVGAVEGAEETSSRRRSNLDVGISPVALESYREKIERLSLPPFLIAYLTHARDVRALEEEEEEEASDRMEREFGVDEGFGAPSLELDLNAMD